MRTTTILRSAAVALALLIVLAPPCSAQCANDNTAIAGGAITPTCPGTTNIPCVQGGQYALVNVTNGYQYTFATCGAAFDTQITLYNNTGGGSMGFNDDSGTCGAFSLQSYLTWTSTFSGQLRVLVDQYNCVTNGACAPLAITCSPPPPPVTNTDPCNATPMALVTSCGGGTYTNAGGGNSATTPAPTCSSFTGASQDVWFTFVAGPMGSVNLQSTAGSLTDGAIAVYSAPSCSGPFTQIACDDDSGPGFMPQLNLVGLTPGQTYYVRYWGYGNATGSFTLCIQGVSTVPPGSCVYTLNLFDSFGDGWGTSFVGVSLNGGPFQNYTVAGTANIVYIPATPGTIIVLNYNASGTFQNENSYSLTLGAGAVFNSGSPPTAGNAYAGTLTCNPPPAPPEDCVGSVTLCNNQAFNNNTNNTGNVADLNATSAGCLLNTERQGTWYNFSPSAGGQIGFTIDPSNPADDYDFAIWGPFPPGSTPGTICPPLSAPLRCSYAAPSGATGLNFTATDLTETAAGDKWVQYLNVTVGQVYLLYVSNWSQSGLAFNLTWDLQGGASLDCTQLGLSLLGLVAHDEAEGVRVDWTSAAGTDIGSYVVERLVPGGEFLAIGMVPGSEEVSVPVHYEYLDRSAPGGLVHYRLRLLNAGTGSDLSPVVSVLRNGASSPLVLVPNPSSTETTVHFTSDAEGRTTAELIDARGRSTWGRTFITEPGAGMVRIPVAGLDPGTYVVRLFLPSGQVLQERVFVLP